jgi:hypothetical protein
MCVLFVSLVRVPSMKVSAAVLGSLFLYDIFWVYLSHHFFGENVMYRHLNLPSCPGRCPVRLG